MSESSHEIAIKRAYDPPGAGDGERILVDRLWPRGLRKDAAQFDQWRKDLSPSTELRQWYGHRPERFPEFSRRYLAELVDLSRHRSITLLTASRDLAGSEVAVLANHLERIIKRRSAPHARGPRAEVR